MGLVRLRGLRVVVCYKRAGSSFGMTGDKAVEVLDGLWLKFELVFINTNNQILNGNIGSLLLES